MSVDVRSAAGIQQWVKATEDTFGGIDALMTNSGGPPAGQALSFDDAAWQDAAELLLFSTLRMVRAAVPSMTRRGGGAILMSTSSSVKEPIPNLGLSTVLRASVAALAKTLALELAASGIRVNQIIRAGSTPTVCDTSTRSTPRGRGCRWMKRKTDRSPRFRSDDTAPSTSSAASEPFCCRTPPPT